MKKCKSCEQELREDFFYKAPKTKDGLRSTCIACVKEKQAAWRAKNPDYHKKWREKNPTYQKIWRDKHNPDAAAYAAVRRDGSSRAFSARSIFGQILKMNPCVDCGEDDPIVLECDHLKDKDFNIGTAMRGVWKSSFWDELEKCDIVCANCHKRRTANRNNSWRLNL